MEYSHFWYWPRPVVTLHSEFLTSSAVWKDGDGKAETFTGMGNALNLEVTFAYDHPYGNQATYRVTIDRKYAPDTWEPRVLDDTFVISIGNNDSREGQRQKNYKLPIELPYFRIVDYIFDYRWRIWIEADKNHMDGPYVHNFTAIFKTPSPEAVEASIMYNQKYLLERLEEYKKHRQAMTKKKKSKSDID